LTKAVLLLLHDMPHICHLVVACCGTDYNVCMQEMQVGQSRRGVGAPFQVARLSRTRRMLLQISLL